MRTFLLAMVAILAAGPVRAGVRPVSEAEHAAVQIAVDYLSRGAIAVSERLSESSPLRAQRNPLAEIEVRLGPREGARWELQTVVPALADRMAAFAVTYPSGFDDTIIFELVEERGAWRVNDIRFLAENRAPASSATPAIVTEAPRFRGFPIALFAAALSGVSALFARRRVVAKALLTAAVVLIGIASFLEKPQRVNAASVIAQRHGPPSLAPLLAYRRAIAAGTTDTNRIYDHLDRADGRGAIADLWKLQSELQTHEIKSALDERFPSPSRVPLAEILRGRLALFENDEAASALAYEHAVSLGPGRDGVWYETAEALMALGYDTRAARYLERLARIGSRDANVYYALALLAARDGREEESERLLRQAWSMRPVERARLFAEGTLWSVLRRPGVTGLVHMSAAGEPLVMAKNACTRPIVVPAGAITRTSGDFLHVQFGEQQLYVPGGAALAPVGTPVVAATEWDRADEERSLADFPALVITGRNAASYAQPAQRQRLVATANALASRNRWSDLVMLTDGLTPASEHIPPQIFFLRSVALQRMQRSDEAKRLLAEVAASDVLQRRRDPDAFIELAELLASHDLYDAAVRMYDRAQSLRANGSIDDRVRQIQMNKRLATKYSTFSTAHFDIHYPDDVSAHAAAELGDVLESELRRLQAWIPTRDFRRVVVNVVWWREFRATYTGSDFILGFYNGKITVPLAGVPVTYPPAVAILGHELSHAMIAQATADQAPRWFQEGLAQRIELATHHENAFNMYDDDKLLPLALLDPVLRASPDPDMIGAAYIVAHTDVRYIEARHGRAGLQKMMDAFRDGATTAEAVERVCGKSLAQFDTDLRAWGRGEQRVFDETEAP